MMLADYKREFIEFALAQGVLKFGEFELKSGRISPYFFNAGEFNTGQALGKLGIYYAAALMDSGMHADCLFGPAYKGIPLVATTAIAMADRHQVDMPWVFNRKEVKDHGEGGLLVGAPLRGDVVILDDVITSGKAIREVMGLFTAADAKPVGVLVAIDRQERGTGELSAIQEVERDYQIPVLSVVNLDDIISYLQDSGNRAGELGSIAAYRARYGVASGR